MSLDVRTSESDSRGITESSTDPPAVPSTNRVGDAFGKSDGQWEPALNRSVNCRDGWLRVVRRAMSIMDDNYIMTDSKGKRGDDVTRWRQMK